MSLWKRLGENLSRYASERSAEENPPQIVPELRVLLLGLPGAGKGVQGERLAGHFGVPHLSLGDFVRDQVAGKTEFGRDLQEVFGESEIWQPLPDVIAIKVAKQSTGFTAGWILDGFPRNTVQAESASFLEPITVAIFLNVSETVARKRVLSRKRKEDSIEKFERRLLVERERLPDLLEYIRSHWWLLEIDADQSLEKVEASILAGLGISMED